MPDQLSLPVCVLPGCSTPVTAWGQACTNCIDAFGPMLRETAGPPMTEDEIRARDTDVTNALAWQRMWREAKSL